MPSPDVDEGLNAPMTPLEVADALADMGDIARSIRDGCGDALARPHIDLLAGACDGLAKWAAGRT